MRRKAIILAAGLAVAVPIGAEAGLKICNDTDVLQSIAIGYKGESDWTSEGWWNIAPDECVTPVEGDLTKRYYYYHADAAGRTFQGQDYFFCAEDAEFTIVGDTDCESRGFDRLEFREIDTGETETAFTLTLIEDDAPPVTGKVANPSGSGSSRTTGEEPDTLRAEVSAGDLRSGITPGTHGAAATAEGYFQGCELQDGAAYCSFHSGGRKLRAAYDGPTPTGLMLALETMPVGTRVSLDYDLVQSGDIHAEVVFREVVAQPDSSTLAGRRGRMQGDWQSLDAPKLQITIRGSEMFQRLDGKFTGARFLQIAETCDGSKGTGPVLIQTSPTDRTRSCYRIDTLSDAVMDLHDPATGQTLSFRKIK